MAWPAFLQFESDGAAYTFSCAGSALIGTLFLTLEWAVMRGLPSLDELTNWIVGGFSVTASISLVVSGLIGLPVSWAARRLRLESLTFYLIAGALAGGALALAIFGRPAPGEGAFAAALIAAAPVYGASWAYFWWQTYRRSRANLNA
jgi:hypothetical protein